ncbi:MAG: tetratricopeptide repeat protein [Acidobacteriota bacterium]|nr:tetratricopeptide repeat protein [Acidobacteriota bacterium]
MKFALVLGGCLGLTLLGQIKPPTGGGGGAAGGSTGAGNTRNSIPSSTTTPDYNQRPMYLSGKVMMDDGTPPADSVTIQITCGSTPRSVAHTDSSGNFSVDLNNRNNIAAFADASQSSLDGLGGYSRTSSASSASSTSGSMGGLGSSTSTSTGSTSTSRGNLMGCDLSAQLAGFKSDPLHLSNRQSLDNPDVGTLILHRLGKAEGTTISATTTMAPKDARKAFDKGRAEAKKERWEQAERELQKAVDLYPKFAMAWFELGFVQESRKNEEAARKSYERALACDSKFLPPYQQLAIMDASQGKWQEVADETDRLLRSNPTDYPVSWYYYGLANYQLKKYDLAEKSLRNGIKVDVEHRAPRMEYLLGIILANKRDLAGAAEHLRNYLVYSPNSPDFDQVKKQLEKVEQLTVAQRQ